MAIVDQDFLDDFRTETDALFDKIFGEAPGTYTAFTTEIATSKEINKMNWLGAPPMLQEFKGSTVFGKALTHDYTVIITEQAIGIEISKAQFRRDDTGTIALFIANFMVQAAKYREKTCHQTLSDGFDTDCFDGEFFYDTDHSFGGSTYNNLITTLLDSETTGNYEVAWTTINTALDDAGEPLGSVPDLLVVHPTRRVEARKLLHSELISDGTTSMSNVLKNDVDLLVSPWLNQDTDEWHLLAAGVPLKPVMLFVEQEPELLAQNNMDSDASIERGMFRYKIESAIKRGFGDPRLAYASNGSAA